MKIVKTLLRKTEKTALNPYEALLGRHNTPTIGMATSSTRTEIPTRGTLLTPKIEEKVLEEETRKTKKSEVYYNKSARDRNHLKPGDIV